MLKPILSRNWLPAALRRDHPLTRYHLRKPPPAYVKQVLFGSSLGLFLLFGGLSLPMLYFLCSLVVLLQLATGTTQKYHQTRADGISDLVSLTLLPQRDILLSTWASGIWQLRQTWLMPLYRVSHGVLLIGVLIFTIVLGEVPSDKALLILVGVTLLIAIQPYVEMYFSGMIGLLCATRIRDRYTALTAATLITIVYWALWIAGALLVAVSGIRNLANTQILLIFTVPIVVPIIIGYVAQHLAERTSD